MKISDDALIERIRVLGQCTVRWRAPDGCKVGIAGATIAQLDRLFKGGALDRQTYSWGEGRRGFEERMLETAYFPPATRAPIPSWAERREDYPTELARISR